jgi:hypothetical protein
MSVKKVVQADKNGEISSHIQFQLIIEQEKRWQRAGIVIACIIIADILNGDSWL